MRPQAKASLTANASQDPSTSSNHQLHTTVPPLVAIALKLRKQLQTLSFREPTSHTYNPLDYAWEAHKQYLSRFGQKTPREMLWLGMNPGPWGMSQTGIPFGAVPFVRDWMQIQAPVQAPQQVHPKRPIDGFSCTRVEVSGQRLWGWAQQKAPQADDFFERIFLHAYCPLAFLEASGKNRTPDRLHKDEKEALFALCDQALRETVEYLQPQHLIAVGGFAEMRLKQALGRQHPPIHRILHPSPANPHANHGWAQQVEETLLRAGISTDFASPP